MRWMWSAAVVAAMCSIALGDHLSPGGRRYGSFSGYSNPGWGHSCNYGHGGWGGWGGGIRSGSIVFGSPGLGVFGAARLNMYNTFYGSFGLSYGPIVHYRGPVYNDYLYDPYYGNAYGGYPAYPAPIQYYPQYVQPAVPFQPNNPALFDPQPADAAGLIPQADQAVDVFIRPSNAESKRRSIRSQAFGDEWFARKEFAEALKRYKDAASAAPDRAEPRLRIGIALCAIGHPEQAAREIKRSLKIDPTWPATSDRLDDIYGGDAGDLARTSMLLRLSDWVREDVRDPDRLFVMGTMLFLNNDPDQALPFLKTAAQLSGNVAYLDPFVKHSAAVVVPAPDEPVEPIPAEGNRVIVQPRQPQNDTPVDADEPAELPRLRAPDAVPDAAAAPRAPGRIGPRLRDGTFGDEF